MIWLTGDTHFGMKMDNKVWLDDCFGYFTDVLLPYMRENVSPGDTFVHLGDVFDNRQTVGLDTITRTMNLFGELAKIFNDVRIVVGNHDMFNKNDNRITSIKMLEYIPNIKIYYEPTVETIDGKLILFNPWIEDSDKQKELLRNFNGDYVFGHLEVKGSVSNCKGTKMLNESSIPTESFKKAQVYAGHIHIKQDMKNIHYVGTPYQKDRGDRGTVKGITVLEPVSGKSVFLENEYSPRFIQENLMDILDMTVEDIRKRWSNNYIDLNCSKYITDCTFTDLMEQLRDDIKEFKPSGDSTVSAIEITNGDIDTCKNSIDYLKDYIGCMDLDDSMHQSVDKWINEALGKI